MIDEIISAIIGNAIAKSVSRWAPARKASEFAKIPQQTFRRRNRPLYYGMLVFAALGFFSPYFFFSQIASERGLWFAGAIFGLPFSAMLVFIAVVWSVLGTKRARELIFYFETEQKMNMVIFYIVGGPLSLIGIISVLALSR